MKKYTISFSGHRPKNLPWGYNENSSSAIKFKQDMKKLLINKINEGYKHFINGMALGADMMIAEILIELKQEFNITIECAIPCLKQESKWSNSQQVRYKKILSQCDKITYVLKQQYCKNCMQMRNEYMINNSNCLIAVWNGLPSGTENTIKYAKSLDVEIIIMDINGY